MEDIEQIREQIGELADKVYNLLGKVDDREISKIMHEIIDLNEFEMALTERRCNKRRIYTTGPLKDIKEIGWRVYR